jgi:putative endonuclease
MREQKIYFVYIMSNRSKTLYTGITGNLIQRVRRHKLGIASRFTTKYRLDRLVYFERFEDVHNAIEREKEIKGWLRIKKIALIVSVNPAWRDLSLEWFDRHPHCKGVHRSFAAKSPAQDDKGFGVARKRGGVSYGFSRSPKIAVPMRMQVEPSSMATVKS